MSQELIDELEEVLPDYIAKGWRKHIIQGLSDFCQYADHEGAVVDREQVIGCLIEAGYVPSSEISKDESGNFYLVIIGNFIESLGRPPIGPMVRCCRQYIHLFNDLPN